MFENIFGIHEQALQLHGQRVGILATNLANADTPNYKARDIDFSAVLAHTDATPLPLKVTDGALWCYVGSFVPAMDEGVGALWKCFKTGEELKVGYSLAPTFG